MKFCDIPVMNGSVNTLITTALTRTNCGQVPYDDSR